MIKQILRNLTPRSPKPSSGKTGKVVVIGDGVAGLTAAAQLAKSGHKVVLIQPSQEEKSPPRPISSHFTAWRIAGFGRTISWVFWQIS